MVVFILSLLLIFTVALSVVAAFALPHLRAGAPVLTDRGDRLARRAGRPLRPVRDVVWPRLWAAGRPVVRLVGTVVRPVTAPLGRAIRPRVAPIGHAISRAVEEGSVPVAARPPAVDSHGASRSGYRGGETDGGDGRAHRAATGPDGAPPADPSTAHQARDGFEALRLSPATAGAPKRPAA